MYVLILYEYCVSMRLCGIYKHGIIIASENSGLEIT